MGCRLSQFDSNFGGRLLCVPWFSAPTAYMDAPSMTYRATSPLTPFDANTDASKSNSARVARTINEMTRNRYNTKTSNRAHRIGEKYGFGSVGARTSSGAS